MKCLIIGLGTFGATLATSLTNQGHEVIGVDPVAQRVEDMKDLLSVAYIMDATERNALKQLPLNSLDCVVVCIGQNMDYSLRTVVALKELGVKKVHARAIDNTHRSILRAMQIEEIFIPEEYAARMFAEKLQPTE
jgi:trk system potassium uptake protein TrkA